jgi:hypothetical protein
LTSHCFSQSGEDHGTAAHTRKAEA